MTTKRTGSLDSHGPARVEVMFGGLEWVFKLNRSDSELRLGERLHVSWRVAVPSSSSGSLHSSSEGRAIPAGGVLPAPGAHQALRRPPGGRGGLLLPALHGGHPPSDRHAHCLRYPPPDPMSPTFIHFLPLTCPETCSPWLFLTSWTSGFTRPLVSTFDPCHLWDPGSLWSLGSSNQTDLSLPRCLPYTPLPRAPLVCAVAPENPVVEVREQAVEGGEVELSCLVPRSRPAAVLRWYRDRKELKGTEGAGRETGTRGA
jgi:hypothetical protein